MCMLPAGIASFIFLHGSVKLLSLNIFLSPRAVLISYVQIILLYQVWNVCTIPI